MDHSSLRTEDSEPKLIIGNSALRAVDAHAVAAFPEECCGILLGRSAGTCHVVAAIVSSPNIATDDRARCYEIDPQQVLEALLRAKRGEAEVIGFYHSHPDGSATPSRLDRKLAWPEKSYLIMGIDARQVVALRSWRSRAGGAALDEESVLAESVVENCVPSTARLDVRSVL
jgi:proteasome lid subunit RPN8/RPN11